MNLLRPIDRTVSVKGLKLHLLDWGGEGRTPLLLLHGGGFGEGAHALPRLVDDLIGMGRLVGGVVWPDVDAVGVDKRAVHL